MRRSQSSRRVALGGIFGALALVSLLMGSVFPAATFVAPAVSGLLIVPVAVEFGMRAGTAVYAAVSVLSLILVPDREMSLFFIFLLGHYPLLKVYLERMRGRVLRFAAKFAVFNVSVLIIYGLLLIVFPVQALLDEFSGTGQIFLAALWFAGNVTFFIYDAAVRRIVAYYCVALRPRLFPL